MSTGDERAKILGETTLSEGWTRLSSYDLDYVDGKGTSHRLKREIYHRTPAACVLLHDPVRDTVVLVRQFRLPAHVIGEPAFLLEVPAGLTDGDDPEAAIRREVLEETGYRLRDIRFLFRGLTSPGSVTEMLHFFHAEIDPADRVGAGGGLVEESEDIEVVELPLDEALALIASGGIIDVKTITLLQWAKANPAA